MCVGKTLEGCLLEVFGDQWKEKGRFITKHEAITTNVSLLEVQPGRGLKVADIRDKELFNIGADSQLFSGSYLVSREWSFGFMKHRQRPCGLLFNSRHNPANTNLVLFGRRGLVKKITVAWTTSLFAHPDFESALKSLRVGFVDDSPKPTETWPK